VYLIYGTTDCPWFLRAQALLMEAELQYVPIIMDWSSDFRESQKEKWGWKTLPIIVLKLRPDDEEPMVIGGTEELRGHLFDPIGTT
jgi:glutaredoxin